LEEPLTTNPAPEEPREDGQPTDRELVERAQKGDGAAFAMLVERHQRQLYRLAMRMTGSEADAQEVLQEAFLNAYQKLPLFRGEAQFSSWLYRVAANSALMRLRAQRRHPEISTEELPVGFLDNQGQLPAAGENWARRPDDQLQSDELRRDIQAAVDALPELYRTVFLIRDVEGLSTEETAELLNISVPTVKTRLHRARIALRNAIASYFDKA